MTALDIDFVRAQFPAFRSAALEGQAHFENAGGSYPCRAVVERLTRFYESRKVQPYWAFPASRAGGEEMDEARARLAAMLNVAGDELHFGPSTSQNTYVLAQAFRGLLRPGDAIVVTNQDHEANSGVWRRLEEAGIEVREWGIERETGHLDPAALAGLLDERVRLVAFPHVSNIVGEENPVAAIAAIAREVGAVACVDGVAAAPHGLPDVEALGADIYLFSTYKTFGPHQGVMVVRRALAERLPNQGHFFNAEQAHKRLVPAGPDHAQIAACAGIADYVEALHARHLPTVPDPARRAAEVRGLQRAHEAALLGPLIDYLRGRDDARLIGPTGVEGRVATVSVALARPGDAVAAELAAHGIMCGGGHFYALRLVHALGIEADRGVLRLSFVHYTHPEEVGRLIAALDAVL
jgi:selenocysteine lyase/cysteine desulfurase